MAVLILILGSLFFIPLFVFIALGRMKTAPKAGSLPHKRAKMLTQVFVLLSLFMVIVLWCSWFWPELLGITTDPYPVKIADHPIPKFSVSLPMFCLLFIFSWVATYFARQLGSLRRYEVYSLLSLIVGYIPLGLSAANILKGLSWGRPLRINGHEFTPNVEPGDNWVKGEQADAYSLDPETKKALEALWLHDARKEFASVPAFSRLMWQLTALGAPPDLLKDLHLAGLQEIDHTQRCLALASGFGDHNWSVSELPEILDSFNNITGDPYAFLAKDSLLDGCLLESFNADTAEEAAKICKDPNSLKVIEKIAHEERFHAEISWRILEFCFSKNPKSVKLKILTELENFPNIPRPTMASDSIQPLVDKANPELLAHYGRLPDSRFDALWNFRLKSTIEKTLDLIAPANVRSSNLLKNFSSN